MPTHLVGHTLLPRCSQGRQETFFEQDAPGIRASNLCSRSRRFVAVLLNDINGRAGSSGTNIFIQVASKGEDVTGRRACKAALISICRHGAVSWGA